MSITYIIDRLEQQAAAICSYIAQSDAPAPSANVSPQELKSDARELVARACGFRDWNEATEVANTSRLPSDKRLERIMRFTNNTVDATDFEWALSFKENICEWLRERFDADTFISEPEELVTRLLGVDIFKFGSYGLPWEVRVGDAMQTLWQTWSTDLKAHYLNNVWIDMPERKKRVEELARCGHAESMSSYAFDQGFKAGASSAEGMKWMLAAAAQGHLDAINHIALDEEARNSIAGSPESVGSGLTVTPSRQRAIDAGHTESMLIVARRHINEDDFDSAYPLLARGCVLGDAHCCWWQAELLALGLGVKKDPYKALDTFLRVRELRDSSLFEFLDGISPIIYPGSDHYSEIEAARVFGRANAKFKKHMSNTFSRLGIRPLPEERSSTEFGNAPHSANELF